MNLLEVAESDLALTLEDAVNGFGKSISVTDPSGNNAVLNGQAGDIGITIDPTTGQAVTGRLAHIALRISSIEASALVGLPRGQADNTKKPWIFEIEFRGNTFKYIVQESHPDRTLGVILCIIEAYKDG